MPASVNTAPNPATTPAASVRFGANKNLSAELMASVRFAIQFQKIVFEGLAGNQEKLETVQNSWPVYEQEMKKLEPAFKDKTEYGQELQKKLKVLEQKHHLVMEKYPEVQLRSFEGIEDILELGASDNAPGNSASTSIPAPQEPPASESQNDGNNKDFKKQAAANWTPREERTRWAVMKDFGRQYFTGGPLLHDALWSLGIGAVLAIGSPVMAVTIPTTLTFFLAGRAVLGLFHACQDPQGDAIDEKYQKWIEKDAAKLKKQAEKAAS